MFAPGTWSRRTPRLEPWALALLVAAAGCGGDTTAEDAGAGLDAGATRDGGPADAARADAGSLDGAIPDAGPSLDATDVDAGPLAVLMFTRTEGYRHASIEDGVEAVQALAAERGWMVEHTEEVDPFTPEGLASFQVVLFLNTTGDVLDSSHEDALEGFVRAGGGWVGAHSASDTEYGWPFYAQLVGALFEDHPAVQDATLDVEDRSHPSTAHLGETWMRRDEWYNFRSNPRGDVTVLLTIDESTYSGGTMGDHPIAWHHAVDGGRAFYTAGGHTRESWSEPDFRAHLAGGIEWAAGR